MSFPIMRPFFTQSTEQFDQLLVAVSITVSSSTTVLTARSRWHPPDPTKHTASSSVQSDLVLVWRKMLGGINPRLLAFRILKIDPLFFACHNPMQERLSFLSGKQNLACVLASLHLPIVYFMLHSFSDLLNLPYDM